MKSKTSISFRSVQTICPLTPRKEREEGMVSWGEAQIQIKGHLSDRYKDTTSKKGWKNIIKGLT